MKQDDINLMKKMLECLIKLVNLLIWMMMVRKYHLISYAADFDYFLLSFQ